MCVLQSNSWLYQSTDCQSCHLITIDTIDNCSSDLELIVPINWQLILSTDNNQYDQLVLFRVRVDCVNQLTDMINWCCQEQELIVSINWLIWSTGVVKSKDWLCQSTDWYDQLVLLRAKSRLCRSTDWFDQLVLLRARIDCVNQLTDMINWYC